MKKRVTTIQRSSGQLTIAANRGFTRSSRSKPGETERALDNKFFRSFVFCHPSSMTSCHRSCLGSICKSAPNKR
ncbi:hypothetical protein TYRP_011742 [Tyrophagus putrescentiae]|nr:hypothetical protein TYRP_011742 [Tyrophagus putrescentiae]